MSKIHQSLIGIVAKEGLDFFRLSNTVIEALCITFFVLVESVEQVVHPFFEFFLLFFRQFIETELEFISDVGSVNRFITNDQFDDFRNVGQFVVTEIVERCEETRVEEEGFKEDAGNLLFKRRTIEVDFVDNFSFSL